jgi:hypothetical protein
MDGWPRWRGLGAAKEKSLGGVSDGGGGAALSLAPGVRVSDCALLCCARGSRTTGVIIILRTLRTRLVCGEVSQCRGISAAASPVSPAWSL